MNYDFCGAIRWWEKLLNWSVLSYGERIIDSGKKQPVTCIFVSFFGKIWNTQAFFKLFLFFDILSRLESRMFVYTQKEIDE